MRLAVHTVICCCVFTTVLPLVKGATGDLNTSLKKRFRGWLKHHIKRDLADNIHTGSQQDESANSASPPSSPELNPIRAKRSTSAKSSGCVLFTCTYHDLIHRLHQMNQQKQTNAPEKKISSRGYGRRRRALLVVTQPATQTDCQTRITEAASKVSLADENDDN